MPNFRQFKRSFRLQLPLLTTVEGFTGNPIFRLENVEDNGLRVAFDVRRKDTGDPAKCVLRIWNLDPDTRKRLRQDLQARKAQRQALFLIQDAQIRANSLKAVNESFKVRVFAGYGPQPEIVFAGDVLEVKERVRVSMTDVVTEMTLGDSILGIIDGYISQTFGVATTVNNILNIVANAQGTPLAIDAQAIATAAAATNAQVATYTAGNAVVGKPKDIIDEIADLLGLQWFVTDGQIKMLPAGTALTDFGVGLQEGVELLDFTSFEDDEDVRGACNLSPTIVPGRGLALFDRKGIRLNGLSGYRTNEVRHFGDTHGADWRTEFHATKATIPIPTTAEELTAQL